MLFTLLLLLACGDTGADTETDVEWDLSTTATTSGGTWQASWRSDPDPIPFNEPFSVTFSVEDAPEDLTYALDVTMPEHGHGMQVDPVTSVSADGLLAEGLVFHMTGIWELVLTVDPDGEAEDAVFYVDCCD